MFIIDRFEDDWAVIEYNRKTFTLPRGLIPPGAAAGDIIVINVGIDTVATARLKEEVRNMARGLFKE